MLSRVRRFISAGFFLLILSVYCMGGSEKVYEVDGVYSFTLTNLNGESMNFADLRGKAVMLNAWATWCVPCINEIPVFVRLYDKYKDKGLEIWGVSTDILGKSEVEPVVERLSINYPVLLARDAVLSKILGIPFRGLPVTVFFDTEGRIVNTLVGPADAYVDKNKGETVESWFERQILDILPEEY